MEFMELSKKEKKEIAKNALERYQLNLQQEDKYFEEYQDMYKKAEEKKDYDEELRKKLRIAGEKYEKQRKETNSIARAALHYVMEANLL